VNPYEILLMLDSELAEDGQNEVIARVRELVESRNGAWQGHEPWGRRKLAYEIGRRGEAYYHLLLFDADAPTLDEISRVLKITDGVMRHMAVRRPLTGSRRPQPVGSPQ
jgi:small subunit ribosomal protein S6